MSQTFGCIWEWEILWVFVDGGIELRFTYINANERGIGSRHGSLHINNENAARASEDTVFRTRQLFGLNGR